MVNGLGCAGPTGPSLLRGAPLQLPKGGIAPRSLKFLCPVPDGLEGKEET